MAINRTNPIRSNRNNSTRRNRSLPERREGLGDLEPANEIPLSEAWLLYPINQLASLTNEMLDLTGQDTTLLATPGGSASPFDCDAYPNSPFCGHNPFTNTPFGYESEIVYNDCETCVRITPIIGFTKLPPLTYCRRSNEPGCRESEPPPPPPSPEPEETEEPTPEEWELIGQYPELEINAEKKVKSQLSSGQGLEEYWENEITLITRVNTEANIISTFEQQFKVFAKARNCTLWKVKKNNERYDINAISIYNGWSVGYPGVWKNQRAIYYVIDTTVYQEWLLYGHEVGSDGESYTYPYEDPNLPFSYNPGRPPSYCASVEYVPSIRKYRYWFGDSTISTSESADSSGFRNSQVEGLFNRISPPEPVPQPKMNNDCCRDILNDLRKIKKLIGNPNKKIPARLIMPGCPENDLVEVKSLADNLEFVVRQIDRAVGWLPLEIEIEDTNTMQEGNQPLKMRIESLGDAITQLLEILLESATDINTIQNIVIRTLWETGLTHKLAAENQLEIQEIIEFLGFKVQDAVEEVPFCFNPTPEGLKEMLALENASEQELERMLPKLLQEATVKIRYTQNDDKKTLVGYILDILKETAIAASSRSVKVKDEAGLTKYMDGLNTLMNISQLMMLRSIRKALYGKKPEDFEEELNELERRYTKGATVPPAPNDNDAPYQEELATDEKFKINLMTNFHGRFANPSEYTTTTWQDEETTQD